MNKIFRIVRRWLPVVRYPKAMIGPTADSVVASSKAMVETMVFFRSIGKYDFRKQIQLSGVELDQKMAKSISEIVGLNAMAVKALNFIQQTNIGPEFEDYCKQVDHEISKRTADTATARQAGI